MIKGQQGQFTYAGAFDHSFDSYADILRTRLHDALVFPLRYQHTPDSSGGPYMGTIGLMASKGAIVIPMGEWQPRYFGDLPYSELPKLVTPEPWETRGNP